VSSVTCHPARQGGSPVRRTDFANLFQTMLNTQPRPIPSALARQPPRARPRDAAAQKFGGARLRVFSKYAEDETNTRFDTVLLMMVGGDRISGIHGAPFGPGVHIRFAAADPARQSIPWVVEYRNDLTWWAHMYVSVDPPGNSPDSLPKYDMQCVDCHNRPTHAFDVPECAMDKALAGGANPRNIAFHQEKKRGVATD